MLELCSFITGLVLALAFEPLLAVTDGVLIMGAGPCSPSAWSRWSRTRALTSLRHGGSPDTATSPIERSAATRATGSGHRCNGLVTVLKARHDSMGDLLNDLIDA